MVPSALIIVLVHSYQLSAWHKTLLVTGKLCLKGLKVNATYAAAGGQCNSCYLITAIGMLQRAAKRLLFSRIFSVQSLDPG